MLIKSIILQVLEDNEFNEYLFKRVVNIVSPTKYFEKHRPTWDPAKILRYQNLMQKYPIRI